MKHFRSVGLIAFTALVATALFTQEANAQRYSRLTGPSMTGAMHFSLGVSTVSAGQDDMNGVIETYNTNNGASIKDLGSAWEFYGQWGYRWDRTMYSFVFRPSYFMQETSGSGNDYKLNGFTVFPIFRIYPLENNFIKFFMQLGAGYGQLNGEISQGSNNVKFKGSAFGAMAGIGADFCFTDAHCLTVEGNMRYLPIERNVTTGGNCTGGTIDGITQCGGSSEVEYNNADLKTTMSGIQGLIGYTMNF